MKRPTWEQVNAAVEAVRKESNYRDDFYRGMQSGASSVAVKLREIMERDAEKAKK